MSQERGDPLRVIIENVRGVLSYPPGGFITGAAIGSNVGVVAMGGSGLGGLRQVYDAMGAGLAIMSGSPTAINSGFTSGLQYVVQSPGISGNQIGIRCFNPRSSSGIGIAANEMSGGYTVLQEVQSGANLQGYNFKVLVQGY